MGFRIYTYRLNGNTIWAHHFKQIQRTHKTSHQLPSWLVSGALQACLFSWSTHISQSMCDKQTKYCSIVTPNRNFSETWFHPLKNILVIGCHQVSLSHVYDLFTYNCVKLPTRSLFRTISEFSNRIHLTLVPPKMEPWFSIGSINELGTSKDAFNRKTNILSPRLTYKTLPSLSCFLLYLVKLISSLLWEKPY